MRTNAATRQRQEPRSKRAARSTVAYPQPIQSIEEERCERE